MRGGWLFQVFVCLSTHCVASLMGCLPWLPLHGKIDILEGTARPFLVKAFLPASWNLDSKTSTGLGTLHCQVLTGPSSVAGPCRFCVLCQLWHVGAIVRDTQLLSLFIVTFHYKAPQIPDSDNRASPTSQRMVCSSPPVRCSELFTKLYLRPHK